MHGIFPARPSRLHIALLVSVAALAVVVLLLGSPGKAGAATAESQVGSSSDEAYHTQCGWPGYTASGAVLAGAPGSCGPTVGGFRFTGLNIPAGATITSAYVRMTQVEWGSTTTTRLALQDTRSPGTFSLSSSPATRWAGRTSFEVQWTRARSTPGSQYQTPSLAAGIQELVDSYGTLNSIVLLQNGTGTAQGQYQSIGSFDTGQPAVLHIEYQAPSQPGATPTPGATQSPAPSATPTSVPPGGPDRLLPSQSPPGGLSPSQVPMFVLLGSDDNNRAGGVEFFVNVFEGRTNPAGNGNAATYDGTPALMSFYLIGTNIYGPNISSQEWRNQYLAAYNDGHEIGNHGFYGLASDAPRGTVQNWLNNWIRPTHEALLRLGIAPEDIHGYRAAEDAIDPAMYEALKQMGYEYANSSTTNHSSNDPAWWAGTLDNGWPGGATWDNRNYGNHTDIWEIPQTYATGSSLYCDKSWFDPPRSGTGQDWKEDMQETFLQLYNGNRAPLSLCLHSQDWGPVNALASGGSGQLTSSMLERQRAMDEFLDWLLSGQFPEVRIVTHHQLLDWMRNPVALNGASPQPTSTPPAATATPTQPVLTATPTATPPSGQPHTLVAQVSSSADDAYHSPSGWPNYSHTSTVVYAGYAGSSGPAYGGWRWTGLDIPAGAQIISAYVELDQAGWGYACTTTLSLQNAKSPAAFSQSSTPYNRWQSRTGFQVTWSWQKSVPGAWVSTPDISAGIQELVDRHGLIDSLVLLESGQGVTNGYSHEWQAFDGQPQMAAKLHVTWAMPGG